MPVPNLPAGVPYAIFFIDLQYYISFRCIAWRFSIFVDYTPVSYYKIMTAIPCAVQYIPIAYLLYFTHSSLYLLIPYPYLAPPCFPLPTENH